MRLNRRGRKSARNEILLHAQLGTGQKVLEVRWAGAERGWVIRGGLCNFQLLIGHPVFFFFFFFLGGGGRDWHTFDTI